MSQFVEVKTAKLIGPALDWAVAKAVGLTEEKNGLRFDRAGRPTVSGDFAIPYQPSTNWAQGGPLIDKYKPWISPPVNDPDPEQPYGWDAEIYDEAGFDVIGRAIGCPSNLIAICRAIVVTKLGDVVQVPADLVVVE